MSPGDEASDKISQATVEVIADQARMVEARQQWADHRRRELARLLANPQEIHAYDREVMDLLEASREFSTQRLMGLRDDVTHAGSTRISAMIALKLFNVQPDLTVIAKLASSDQEARRQLFLSWRDLFARGQAVPQSMIDLTLQSIDSEDPHLQSMAADSASWSRITAAAPALLSQIRSQPDADRVLLHALAELKQTDEILEALKERLPSNMHDSHGCLQPVAILGLSAKDPALQRKAAQLCLEYLKRQEDSSSIAGDASDALKLIVNAFDKATAKETLSGLALSSKWRLLRRYALDEVSKLDKALASDIAWAAEMNQEQETKSEHLTNSELTPRQAAEICVRHGVLDTDEAQRAAGEECRLRGEGGGGDPVFGLFVSAGRLTGLVMDTGFVPVRHDLVLMRLAKGSVGRFRPEAALESYRDNLPEPTPEDLVPGMPGRWVPVGKGTYKVQFIHDDRLYRLQPRDFGDWYDLDAVLTAANRALGDSGVPDRFVAMDDTGDCAVVIFAKPEPLHAAAGELGLKLRPAL